jgi:hypothetical protein
MISPSASAEHQRRGGRYLRHTQRLTADKSSRFNGECGIQRPSATFCARVMRRTAITVSFQGQAWEILQRLEGNKMRMHFTLFCADAADNSLDQNPLCC